MAATIEGNNQTQIIIIIKGYTSKLPYMVKIT